MTALKQEIKQTRPFGSLEEEVYLSLRLTAQLMDEPWARYLRKTEGISPSQYNLLRILRGAGVDGRTMGEIGERMINRDPDVTRLADRTVKLGLARRDRDEADRRVVKLFITQRGIDMLERLDASVHVFVKQTLGGLGQKRLKQLCDLLVTARASIRPFPPAESSP
jgi:DNA-binding MarR family transcriptional regulator